MARVIEIDPANYQNHAWLSYDYARVAVFDAARYHARMCTKLHPEGAACAYSIARTAMLSGDIAAARKTVLDAMTRNPQSSKIQLAQGELQYFIGDCAGALRSIAQARPEFARTEVALDLRHHEDGVAIFAWCLRKQGETARARRSESIVHRATRAPGNRRGVRAPACANGRGDGRPRGLGGSPDRAREHPLSGLHVRSARTDDPALPQGCRGCGPAGQTGRAPRRVAADPAEGLDAGADPRRAGIDTVRYPADGAKAAGS